MDWDKLISFKICAIMLYTTTAKQFCPDPKIRGCGMRWEAVIKKCRRTTKLRGVMLELKVRKIEKELRFIKWEDYTILWALNFNSKQFMPFNPI
jgi:hypothetical protein